MATPRKSKWSIRDMAYIAIFAVVLAVCSWICVPYVVPFTLQTFGVFLAVGVLGGRRGTLAVLVYILLGCMGLPVFAGFTGGIGILLGSTGGYILGFLPLALTMWAMEGLPGNRAVISAVSMVLGLAACYALAPSGSCWSTPGPPPRWGFGPCWAGACCPTFSRILPKSPWRWACRSGCAPPSGRYEDVPDSGTPRNVPRLLLGQGLQRRFRGKYGPYEGNSGRKPHHYSWGQPR